MNTEITSINLEPLFPRIMKLKQNPKLLVLFVSDKCGTVVSPDRSCSLSVGVYYTEWDMSGFEEFNGKLELWN